uniref:Uncharacterized protein n=1 Tax=candidate division WOR-3 bacterium TaxID=2052148 RepID=A0A7C2B2Q1_UNCW3
MLRGRLKSDPGYLETWGTFKGILELWQTRTGIEVRGTCTDIVELYSWLLPSIARAFPQNEIELGRITIPDNELERELLKREIRIYLEDNSCRMERVEPSRRA